MKTEREILGLLKTELDAARLFDEVRILDNRADSGGIFEMFPDLTARPCGVLYSGSQTLENGGMTSNMEIALVAIDAFDGSVDSTLATMALLKQTEELLNCNAYANPLLLDGVHFIYTGRVKIALDDWTLSWRLNFLAKYMNL